MTVEELLLLQPGERIRLGGINTFEGRYLKAEHIIDTDITFIWRVYFMDEDPVVCVDTDIRRIETLDGKNDTPICR